MFSLCTISNILQREALFRSNVKITPFLAAWPVELRHLIMHAKKGRKGRLGNSCMAMRDQSGFGFFQIWQCLFSNRSASFFYRF